MTKSTLIKYLLLSLLIVFLLGACSQPEFKKVQFSGNTMGTTYHVTYITSWTADDQAEIQAKIDTTLVEVNQIASTYNENSELSLFNRTKSTAPLQASRELRTMFAEAIQLAQLTEGYLDVTIGPLVNLWGFGPTHRAEKAPSKELIKQTRRQVGIGHLRVEGQSISKSNPELYVDLSTLAKGYGVDAVAELLASEGINNYLVEIGGEIRIAGQSLNNRDWSVGLEKADSETRGLQRIIRPRDNAVATSGDYRIFFEENDVRYSHLINPKTGSPITHRTVSVTVIHPSCMVADGLSTGFLIMGFEKGIELANEHDIAALFITKSIDGEFVEHHSDGFKPFL
ncbi:FAD:protein FMN transferase [Idiomarina sp. 28-8]|uniref:FAD:protein FMN transferase n=1 Tax=Idiomarina sp. 28-8 TaxID=1260624 RepID=UPI0002FB3CC5|nr:FAD:protein FMN transferase [Idiomarina sp. 28-8]